MDDADQIEFIVTLFERLEYEVRLAHLGGAGGGLCQINDKNLLFVDLDDDLATRRSRCVEALSTLADVRDIHLPPVIRDALDQIAGEEHRE